MEESNHPVRRPHLGKWLLESGMGYVTHVAPILPQKGRMDINQKCG